MASTGILYCATLLAENRTEVSVLDQAAQGFSFRQALQWIKKEEADVPGFSVLITSFKEALNIAKQVKTQNPNVVIVFGNYHATFNSLPRLRIFSSFYLRPEMLFKEIVRTFKSSFRVAAFFTT